MQYQPQYTKFEFREFSKCAVVHMEHKNEQELEKERLINEAVAEHLIENTHHTDNESFTNINHQPEINIEEIREESYKHGYDDAKAHFEPLVSQVKNNDSLCSLLQSKLEAVAPVADLQDDVFRLSASLVSTLAKKMHLVLPTDFEAIILGEMLPLLSKYYKMGTITLGINPERVDYCTNLLKIGTLPTTIAENIKIVQNKDVGTNDCKLEWHETQLEYNQEQMILDAEKILEHLKMEINN